MTLLSIFVSIVILVAVAALLGSLVLALRGWRQLSQAEQTRMRQELEELRVNLLALGALLLIPVTLVLDAALGLFPVPVFVTGALLWSILALWFWESRALRVRPELWDDGSCTRPRVPGLLLPGTVPQIPVPDIPGADLVHKRFAWTFQPQPYPPFDQELPQTVEMDISAARYQKRRQETRLPVGQWSNYATADLPESRVLAALFLNLHAQQNWSTFEQASNVLAFTQQCIAYASDKSTTGQGEWPRYPIETLMDEKGDCEDDVILTAAVLARLGFQVALLYYPGHCALGIAGAENLPGEFVEDPARRRRYFYGETTADGWHIGEVPRAYRGAPPEQIEPVEILLAGKDHLG